ncbi:16714_t:CDS:1, partial [Gigaspora margarita]
QLYALFAMLLIFSNIANVRQLWNENFEAMAEDFAHTSIPSSYHLMQATLQHLNGLLQRHSKTVSDYDLLELLAKSINNKLPELLLEKLSYNINKVILQK